jgi:putative inorganic carbon (HCO3(-)) transporter
LLLLLANQPIFLVEKTKLMKIRNIAKSAIIFLPIFLPFFIFRFSIGSIPTTLLEVSIAVVFLFNLFLGNFSFKWSRSLAFALLFVLAALVSTLIDPSITAGLGLFKAYFVDGFLVYLMVISLSDSQKEKFFDLLIISGVVVSLGALILYFQDIKSPDGRIVDFSLLSSNYLAMYLSALLVLAIARIKRDALARTIFLTSAVILFLLVVYLTKSRGVIISVVPALAYLAYAAIKQKTIFKKAMFLFIVVLFFIGGYLYFKPDWSDAGRKATSSNVRYYIWSTSVEMIKSNPLWGVGLSNYQGYFTALTANRVNYPEFIAPQALTAHNIFLQIYLTTGLLGFISFVALVISSLVSCRKKECMAFLVAILAYGLIDTPFFRNDLAILFWIALAICYEDRN